MQSTGQLTEDALLHLADAEIHFGARQNESQHEQLGRVRRQAETARGQQDHLEATDAALRNNEDR